MCHEPFTAALQLVEMELVLTRSPVIANIRVVPPPKGHKINQGGHETTNWGYSEGQQQSCVNFLRLHTDL